MGEKLLFLARQPQDLAQAVQFVKVVERQDQSAASPPVKPDLGLHPNGAGDPFLHLSDPGRPPGTSGMVGLGSVLSCLTDEILRGTHRPFLLHGPGKGLLLAGQPVEAQKSPGMAGRDCFT